MRRIITFFVVACLTACGCENNKSGPNRAEHPGATGEVQSESTAIAADNSAVNQRDRDGGAKTPLDQSNRQPDLDITAKIRQRVVDLPQLSLNARNVKIITADGQVTLRGPVDSAEEHSAIEKIAHDVAGADRVDNQLEVVAK